MSETLHPAARAATAATKFEDSLAFQSEQFTRNLLQYNWSWALLEPWLHLERLATRETPICMRRGGGGGGGGRRVSAEKEREREGEGGVVVLKY